MTPSCTHHSHDQAHCQAEAVLLLAWSEQIAPGWDVSTTRAFCGEHGWLVVARLHCRGIDVRVAERGGRPRRIRGSESHLLVGVTAAAAVG